MAVYCYVEGTNERQGAISGDALTPTDGPSPTVMDTHRQHNYRFLVCAEMSKVSSHGYLTVSARMSIGTLDWQERSFTNLRSSRHR